MSGERVVVVKKQELSLTFGKRGAEAARSSLAELNQKSTCAELHSRAWVVFLRRRSALRSNVRAIQKPGSAWRRSLRKGFVNPLSICMHTFLLMNLSMSLSLE